MADLNKVFSGRWDIDPECAGTTSGSAVTDLRMANPSHWTGKEATARERPCIST